ncbi:MAG: MFS transporter [Thermoanaerobaculaceae bacterium]|nr:MFS transporter [Thermoanaerobaculaceae bacterium]
MFSEFIRHPNLFGNLSEVTRRTLYLHARALFFEGILNGVWLLNDVVARKHFVANPFLLTLLVMAPSASLILSLPLGPLMAKRAKKLFFLLAGVLRLSLLFIPFCEDAFWFVVLAAVASASYPIFFTAQNAILKQNYPESKRGRLFGIIYSFSGFVAILTSLSLGHTYDFLNNSIVYVYPVAAICGFLSCFLLSRVEENSENKDDNDNLLTNPFEILKKEKKFRQFEISFFSYGTGFMMMLPLLPLFLVDHLKVSYTQASFLNGFFYQGMIVLFSWMIGRLSDTINPLKLAKLGFLFLVFYPLSLSIANSVFYAYFVYAWYGICMAIVNVTWYLAPLTFCRKPEEASSFMAVHVALAGTRAFIAFPLGTTLYALTNNFYIPFIVSSIFFLVGFLIMPEKAKGG